MKKWCLILIASLIVSAAFGAEIDDRPKRDLNYFFMSSPMIDYHSFEVIEGAPCLFLYVLIFNGQFDSYRVTNIDVKQRKIICNKRVFDARSEPNKVLEAEYINDFNKNFEKANRSRSDYKPLKLQGIISLDQAYSHFKSGADESFSGY